MFRLAHALRAMRVPGARYASTAPRRPAFPAFGRKVAVASGVGLAVTFASTAVYADSSQMAQSSSEEAKQVSFGTLLRAYIVYTMCSVPALVDSAPSLLDAFSKIPGLNWIADAVVRVTFFDQFVGGDTAALVLPLLRRLRMDNTGCLFAYSVEVNEAEAMAAQTSASRHKSPYKAMVDEMINSIDIAADFEDGLGLKGMGRKTWVAIKMTALVPDASAFIRLSSYILATRPPAHSPDVPFPGTPTAGDLNVLVSAKAAQTQTTLSPEDLVMLRELYADMELICARAQKRGVRIIIDAEYSWYQPAFDAITLGLMRRFNNLSSSNSTQPLIYGTFQAYLRRTPSHLAHCLRDAKQNGYALGVKLVRGAYHPHEVTAHDEAVSGSGRSLSISPDTLPPVWNNKAETDVTYNNCAAMLLDAAHADVKKGKRQSVGILFGTHNWDSCRKIMEGMQARGLATPAEGGKLAISDSVAERVTFGQLYGMCDELTSFLASTTVCSTPMVLKYIPYGALADVMPYLSRRAIENKSVLGDGAAQHERDRAWRLMVAKIFG